METDFQDDVEENGTTSGKRQVYIPTGASSLEPDENWEYDETAYKFYYPLETGISCLSFDVIPDSLGNDREASNENPLTVYLIGGTQAAEEPSQFDNKKKKKRNLPKNSIILLKMSNLKPTKEPSINEDEDDEDEDGEEEAEDDEDSKPELLSTQLPHIGAITRIRCTQIEGKTFAATISDLGKANIWNVTEAFSTLDDHTVMSDYNKKLAKYEAKFSKTDTDDDEENYDFGCFKPITTFGHQTEGFAMDWSQSVPGNLLTGDCKQNIHFWKLIEGGKWNVDQKPYLGHKASVEDIQWSPREPTVFASCSVDKSIRIWDIRARHEKACQLTNSNAHSSDVNVIHWNRSEPFIISGGDDCCLKVWDLRRFKTHDPPVAIFKHHSAPITSVEWCPFDSSIFAATGEDDQLTIWDLAVEKNDDSMLTESSDEPDIPPQLLFIHKGQKEMKELHWHKQCPGVIASTAADGFNIFRTISV